MKTLLYNARQILTCKPQNNFYKRGSELSDPGLIENSSIILKDDKIIKLTPEKKLNFNDFDEVIDCTSKVIIPGLIDCHTHLVFAGSRADEFEMRVEGKTYEEIAQKGGGIAKTVLATRNASKDELISLSLNRLRNALSFGITTIEIKSGYGLDYENEIKMIDVINELNSNQPVEIHPTFLGAHTIPPEYKENRNEYIRLLTEKLIPEISQKKLAKFCDVFLEKTAFSLTETKTILLKAIDHSLIPKLHCNQFNDIGGVDLGIELNVKSLDHLEVLNEKDIIKLSKTEIAIVILPAVSYFLKIPYSPARKMIDEGCIVALASDFNPGSSTTQNPYLIMNMASLYNGMKVNEVINSFTINAAFALGISNRVGSIEINKQADLVILNTDDYRNIVYYFGNNFTETVIKKGKIVYARNH